ncbi:glycosyltransferase family 2 protein [Ferribacterium limneticum]|uniref:glycosyltransferase family 2 protein n=1 Tax=Ferribacterium limneticum TaxID=76259 RepID=UPI0021F5D29E|nr:glycosyltransferase family 2 protein [Ferribacterium limneticum]UCV18281.1 glycosyltransferase family 2 protein [Ferribacterium limneticum]
MATYNGAPYIREQLDSIASQGRLPDELVVCDDGSSDETLSIVEQFSREIPFAVHIYRNESRLGYVRNFQRAIGLCTGDIIFLSDQDDVWFPEKLQRVEVWFHMHPQSLLFMNDAEIVLADGTRTGLTKLEQTRALGLSDDYFVMGCCMAVRSSVLPLFMPFLDNSLSHDGWISQVAVCLGAKKIFPLVLQYYRRHGTNVSVSISSSIRKLGWLDLFIDLRGKDSLPSCLERIQRLDLFESRLRQLGPKVLLPLGFGAALATGFDNIAMESSALRARVNVLSQARWRRFWPATLLFMRGQYRFFSGWKSYVKDLLRA